jgi:hypothetical protein
MVTKVQGPRLFIILQQNKHYSQFEINQLRRKSDVKENLAEN